MLLLFSTPRTDNGQRMGFIRCSAVVALFFSTSLVYGQTKDLGLHEALLLSASRSASIQAAQASVSASREALPRAGQLPDPMIKAGIDNLPINGPDQFSLTRDFMTQRRIGVEQQWVSSDKRSARTERAQRAVEFEQAEYLTNLTKVREETAIAWVGVLFAQRSLGLFRELETEARQDLATTQSAFRGLKTGAAEAAQAQANLIKAQDARRKGEQTLNSARIALARWVAEPMESVSDTLPPLVSHVHELSQQELGRYHPELLRAERAWALADADTTVATRERRPDWTFEAAYSQRGSQYSNMVSVGVSIPFPVNTSERQDRDIAEKSALATKARLQYEDAVRELQAEIDEQSATLESLNERIAELKARLLPFASQQVDLATAAYRAGKGSLAEVFSARKAALETRLQILDVEKEAALTWAKLEYHIIPHDHVSASRSAP